MKHFQSVLQILFSVFCVVTIALSIISPKEAFAIDIDKTIPEVNVTDKNEALYVSDSVIVQFKDEKAPEELAQKVTTRSQQKKSFFGWMQVNVSNIGTAIQRNQTPENQLAFIESIIDKNSLEGNEVMDLNNQGSLYVYEVASGKKIDVKKVIAEFKNDPSVESAFPNAIIQGAYAPNDPAFNDQWHYSNINIPQAWDVTKGDSSGNIIVAIMDSGIERNHQDLAGNILGWYDCRYQGSCSSNSGNDGNGHGTHVAGTVSAVTNNRVLVSGVGHDTKIVSFKILGDDNRGQLNWLINGLNVLRQQYPNKKIIVNMSLSFSVYVQDFENIINQMWGSGMILVAAAGNGGPDDPKTSVSYPAGFQNVISVAATQRNNDIAPYSYRGTWIDVAAPGGYCSSQDNVGDCILSTSNANWANYLMGTSMAAPHVSGALALMWSVNPNLSNQQIRDMLLSSSDRISGTGTYWTYGKINALAGVNSVLGTLSTPTPTVTQTPTPSNTPIPTNTPTNTPTSSPSPTATATPIPAATATPAPVLTGTPTSIPTVTLTTIPTNTPINTQTPTVNLTQPHDTMTPILTQQPTATSIPDVTLPPACDPTSGDADCNGTVDSADYGCWVSEYLTPNAPDQGSCKSADFNSSGKVDLLDFVMWRNTILSQG